MNRTLLSALAIFLFVALAGPAQAQVKVVKKPAPAVGPDEYVVYDSWTSSWGLRDDPPDQYPLGIITHSTQAEAVAAAKAHIARTAGNGNLAVTHYLIEGEASVRSKKGPSLPGGSQLQNNAVASLNEDTRDTLNKLLKQAVDDAFTKKNREIEEVWKTVKEGKEYLYRNVSKLTEDDFNKVNGMVKEYNSKVDKYASEGPNPQYFSALPRATPVNAGDLKRQFDKWKAASDKQDALEKQKQDLDKKRAQLEKERQELIDDGLDSDVKEQEIASLRSNMGGGPFSARISGDVMIPLSDGSKVYFGQVRQKFKTYQEAVDYLKELGYTPGERVTISDRSGKSVTAPPSDDESNKLKSREEGLRSRRAKRQDQVSQYKTDLDAYNRSLQQFEQNVRSHSSSLGDDGYQAHAISEPQR